MPDPDESQGEGRDEDELTQTEQTLPVSSLQRKTRRVIGCLFMIAILGFLIWFGVTHTETARMRGFMGMEVGGEVYGQNLCAYL